MILNMDYYRKREKPKVTVPYVYFTDLRARVASNQICTGYTKNGSEVTFPLTNQTVSDPEHIDYNELGLTPVITTDVNVLKTCKYAETGSGIVLSCTNSSNNYTHLFGTGNIQNKSGAWTLGTFNETLLELVVHGEIFRGGIAGCVNLTRADISDCPKLIAVGSYTDSYAGVFINCKSLSYAKVRELTDAKDEAGCAMYMFTYCISLTKVENLVLNQTVTDHCYHYMFYNCDSLTQAPALPATTLASYCYSRMFQDCNSLTQAPALPATTLASYCYTYMFQQCTNLQYIKLGYSGSISSPSVTDAFSYWVQSVSATGDFYYNGSDTTRGDSAIPTGWTIRSF